MAKIFGDTEDVIVYAEDILIDHNTHELVVKKHGESGTGPTCVATELATEQGITPEIEKAIAAEKIEHV